MATRSYGTRMAQSRVDKIRDMTRTYNGKVYRARMVKATKTAAQEWVAYFKRQNPAGKYRVVRMKRKGGYSYVIFVHQTPSKRSSGVWRPSRLR